VQGVPGWGTIVLAHQTEEELLWIGSCAKLAPQFCGPFRIIKRISPVAYRIALPSKVKVHDVFHVSLLKKLVKDVNRVIDYFYCKWNHMENSSRSLSLYCKKRFSCSETKQ